VHTGFGILSVGARRRSPRRPTSPSPTTTSCGSTRAFGKPDRVFYTGHGHRGCSGCSTFEDPPTSTACGCTAREGARPREPRRRALYGYARKAKKPSSRPCARRTAAGAPSGSPAQPVASRARSTWR
jgi:hypothetical protein